MAEVRVKVIPNVKKESVAVGRDGRLTVGVHAPREEGRANERLREMVAKHFGVAVSAVTIRPGHTSATKTLFVKK